MQVELYKEQGSHLVTYLDVTQFSAATHNFPYWAVWTAVENGMQTVHYDHMSRVGHVAVYGEAEEEGDEHRTVSQTPLQSV